MISSMGSFEVALNSMIVHILHHGPPVTSVMQCYSSEGRMIVRRRVSPCCRKRDEPDQLTLNVEEMYSDATVSFRRRR